MDKNQTVYEYGKQWLRTHERPKKSTRDSYEGTINWLKGKALGRTKLSLVFRADARHLAQNHPSRVGCLSSMFTDAMNDGLIDSNPFHKLGIKRKPGRKDILPYTASEIEFLKQAASDTELSAHEREVWQALIIVLAYTGIRPSEAFALKWMDIDTERGVVTIKRALVNGIIGAPKNGRVRTVVLPEVVERALRAVPKRPDVDWVFTTTTWGPYSKPAAHKVWDKIRRRHSIQMDMLYAERHQQLIEARGKPLLDLYELRHFCATHLLDQGVRPEDVAHQLGHTDGGRLIVSTYGHPDEDKIRDRIRQGFDKPND